MTYGHEQAAAGVIFMEEIFPPVLFSHKMLSPLNNTIPLNFLLYFQPNLKAFL